MAYFQAKNPNLGKFLRVLEWKLLVCSVVIWNILLPCGIFYGNMVNLWSFGIVLPVLVCFTEKNLATLLR
jgi:hypothetical protein